jgi:hypothetical protein
MNIQKCLLLSVVFGAASALSAQSTTLLDDTFTTGATGPFTTTSTTTIHAGIGTQNPQSSLSNPVSSAEWFGIGSSATSTENYTQGVGVSSATSGATVSQGVIAYFEAPGQQASLNVGDSISAAVTFQYATAPANSSFGLHFSLLNSGSTGTQNNQTTVEMGTTTAIGGVAAENYSGYYAQINPNVSTNTVGADSIFYRPTGPTVSTSWVGSNGGSTPLNTPATGPFASLGTDKYKAVLDLTRTNATTDTLTLNLFDLSQVGDPDVAAYDVSDTTTSLVNAFDTVDIGFGTAGPVTVSEVTVGTITAIPEPSTYAAILGAATLGLVAFRSRRQRRMLAA